MSIFYTENLSNLSPINNLTIREKPPLSSATSKIARLRKKIGTFIFPLNKDFPLEVSDKTIGDRVRNILENGAVTEWLGMIKGAIGDGNILEMHLAGSAALWCANLPLLLCASRQFKYSHSDQVEKGLKKKKFSYSDVDIHIKIANFVDLSVIKEKMSEMKGWTINYGDNQVLILTIGNESTNKLDIVIYKKLTAEFAFYSDDFSINLMRSDLKNNIIVINSENPWYCWRGHALRVIENEGRMDHHLFPRVLGKLLKGEVCTTRLEDKLFHCFIENLSVLRLQGKKKPLKFLLEKHWADHEHQVELSRYLLILRFQQLVINHNKEMSLLSEAANIEIKGKIPAFIKCAFSAMRLQGSNIKAIHSAIECIALIALCEGWEHPFQVKLVWHQDKWVLRLRFRGDFGSKDLLLRFDPVHSLQALRGGDSEQIRAIVRSLSIDGIRQREVTDEYINSLAEYGLNESLAIKLRKNILFTSTGKSVFAEQNSLVELEMSLCEDEKELLNIGQFVFDHYRHDLTLRSKLCWEVVNRCLLQSADLVNALRNAGEAPIDGYESLFQRVLKAGGDIEILKACNPFTFIEDTKWALLAKSKTSRKAILAKMIDEANTSGELFLQMIDLSDLAIKSLSEEMLCKIIMCIPNDAAQWIQKMDHPEFNTDVYKIAVSQSICESAHHFDPLWILEYIKSKRFVSDESRNIKLCKHFVFRPMNVLYKSNILELLKVEEPALWHRVANECISQGEILPPAFKDLQDKASKTIVACYEIIKLADSSEVLLKKLHNIQDDLTKPLRGSVLMRLLKNWNTHHDDVPLLEFFDISKKKVDWKLIKEQAKTPKDLLKFLRNGSITLYTALFRTLSPTEECYHKWWVEKILNYFETKNVEDFVKFLEKPQVRDCFLVIKKKTNLLFEKVGESKKGIELTFDVLHAVSPEHLLKMLKAAMRFDDDYETAKKICINYPLETITKKNEEYVLLLFDLSRKILMSPDDDIEIACLICKFLGEIPEIEHLPHSNTLIKLIQMGHYDWVKKMIEKANPIEAKNLEPKVYDDLLKKAAVALEKAEILLNCELVSVGIQLQWEQILLNMRLAPNLAGKLLMRGSIFKISEARITELAVTVFSKCTKNTEKLNKDIQQFFIDRASKLELSEAHALWDALRKSTKIQRDLLWKSGFEILKKNPFIITEFFLNWIISNSRDENVTSLLNYVSKVAFHQAKLTREQLLLLKPLSDWTLKLASKGNSHAKLIRNKYCLEVEDVKTERSEIRTFLEHYFVMSVLFWGYDNFRSFNGKQRLAASLFLLVCASLFNDFLDKNKG